MGNQNKYGLIDAQYLPQHVGVIMDGNGRWAKKRGLPRTAGHIQGAKVFKELSLYCSNRGIKAMTFYAFSTENWKRPTEEIDSILHILGDYLTDCLTNYRDKNIRARVIGDISPLPDYLKSLIFDLHNDTSTKTGMLLNIAINYGSRAEIVNDIKCIATRVVNGELAVNDINEDVVENGLYTAGQPPLDLIIRPSGEQRLSNFLLWQAAYAELWYSDVLWPDFTIAYLEQAFVDYHKRNRRFGGL